MAVLPRSSSAWVSRGEGPDAVLLDLTTGTAHPGTAAAAALLPYCDGETSVAAAAHHLGSSEINVELSLHTLADLGALSFGAHVAV